MDNHKVLCGLIIFIQIAFLPRGSTYNFSLCNHEEIQEDLLNVFDPDKTFTQEKERAVFWGASKPRCCSGHHSPELPSAAQYQLPRTAPARLPQQPKHPQTPTGWSYDSIFTPARMRPPSRRARSSPRFAQDSRRAERAGRLLECLLERARGCGERPELWRDTLSILRRRCPGYCPAGEGAGTPQRGRSSAGRSGSSAGNADGAVRWGGAGSPAPCDRSKARELMAVWRSYNNLG